MSEPAPLYVARHGVTQGNVDRIQIGYLDLPLLPEGREQARDLARRVSARPIREIWTSPLRRAVETAEIVGAACRLPVLVDRDLRELVPGPWEGMTDEQVQRRFPVEYERWQRDPGGFELPGRETLPAVRERIVRAVERIRARAVGTLVITHGDPIRLLRVHYAGEPLNRFALYTPGHAELLEVVRQGRALALRPAAA